MLRNDLATKAELHDLTAGARVRKEAQFDRLAVLGLRVMVPGFGGQVPRRLSVLRTTEHVGEHIGHAELAAQSWIQRASRGAV